MPRRVLYMGTAELACPPLAALHDSSIAEVVGVFTQPDRPGGRKLKPQISPVKQCAIELGLPVFQPETLRAPEILEQVAQLNADLFVVTAYGQILPQALLELPPRGALNVHASLLPRHRGAAPIQWAILEGDTETGITLMQMDAGLDTGDIVAKATSTITEEDTAQSLHDRLAELGAGLLIRSLPDFFDGTHVRISQEARLATYARKISKQDGHIDWSKSAGQIHRMLRAFTPWPGIYTQLPTDNLRGLKIHNATISSTEGRAGEIVSVEREGILVGCGSQSLKILKLQREGSQSLGSNDFLNGCPLSPGQKLG